MFALLFAPSRQRRRSRKRGRDGSTLGGLVIFGGILFAVLRIADIPVGEILGTVAVTIGVGAGAVVLFKFVSASKRTSIAYRTNAAILTKAGQCIDQHVEVLARKKAQLVIRDEYGALRTVAWEKAKSAFIRNQIAPTLSPKEVDRLDDSHAAVCAMIDDKIALIARANTTVMTFSDKFSGTEFESFCADELLRAGWENVRVTQKTGDQGIDIVAMKSDVRLVLQCKMYGRPVGNKAVQEIAAGRKHERAELAAVVSNQSYTVAARRLAATNDVFLLHYADLTKPLSAWPKVGAWQ